LPYIKIDDKTAIDWLAKLIDNTITGDPNSKAMLSSYKQIKAWHDSLSAPIPDSEVVLYNDYDQRVKQEVAEAKAKMAEAFKTKGRTSKRTTAKKTVAKDPDPFTCKEHPKYEAKRVPRTDCKACWALYKQFHPLDYPLKRKDFERKLRNAR
jgi:hypothetical protein